MFSDLRRHAQYCHTGVDWLPRRPAHWEMSRGMRFLQQVKAKNTDLSETTVLSLSYGRIVVKPQDRLHGLVPASFTTYQVLEPGAVVIRPTDLQNDQRSARVGLVRDRGIITSAYLGLTPTGGMTSDYAFGYLSALDSLKVFYGMGSGLRQNLEWADFKRLPMLLPPREEQAAIVRYLAHANRRIDQAIAAKRKLIRLLEEQKRVLATQAITKGLDDSTATKDSGVAWIGEIPTHWSVWPIGRLARVGNGSTPARSNPRYWDAGHFPWLNSSSVNQGIVRTADQFVTATALSECHLPVVPRGSVLIAITGQGKTRGTAAVLEIEATINQHIAFLTPDARTIRAAYLKATLDAAYPELRRISDDSGSTKGALTCGDLKAFRVPVPPLVEQQRILDFVHQETRQMDEAIVRAAHEIDLLREFRTRLTSDVVTGQVDVRSIAASLPEVSLDELAEPVDGSLDDELDELADEFAEDAALV